MISRALRCGAREVVSVVLDLVQPVRAGRDSFGRDEKAEPIHAPKIGFPAGLGSPNELARRAFGTLCRHCGPARLPGRVWLGASWVAAVKQKVMG